MAAVASKNPFALLGEEDSSPAAPATTKKAPAAPEPAAKPKANTRTGPASRGGKYYSRGGARPPVESNPNQDNIQEPSSGGRRPEGRGRGRGGRGRGGRGDRPDRHSQTGRTDSDKKVHQGWGGDDGRTELKDETNAATDATKEATGTNEWDAPVASSWDAPGGDSSTPADGTEKPARKEREPEPEDNTLTLDQYLAQEKAALDVPELEARQVDADWKDVKPLEKSENDDYFVGKTKAAPKARAQTAVKETLEVNFTTPQRTDGRGRGRGGRGGRGGDRGAERGGRGRGGQSNRGQRPATGPSIDDESAFPALS
ncbi:hypothetical protein DL96DRAFT_1575598 [Flagelloscypha sp. PMI_526]|nr:hypothetical protein DL96DRAFT_1575598 [Flagelloscypha sp. PMI_526]